MKIGFDGKRAFNNSSGLGNYSRTLIDSLAQFYPDNEYFVFSAKTNADNFHSHHFRNNSKIISTNSISNTYWRSYKMVKQWNKLKMDIFHGLSNELPFYLNRTKTKTVVTIHDVIFKSHPEFYSVIDRNIYNWKTKHACKAADKIICVSENTKTELIKYYHTPEEKITVIPNAMPGHINRMISDIKLNEINERYQLPDKFILQVGTIERRKNLLTVLKSLHQLGNKALPLVVVGKATEYLKEIKNYLRISAPQLKVVFIHDADNEMLNIVYSRAFIFIYTSLVEGFGIPLIEAAAHGIPSIASKKTCMTEAAGSGALYVDAEDVNQTANAIEQLFNSTDLYNNLSAIALANSSKFSSQNISDKLMKLYNDLIKG